ncbi:hypothetical protein TW021 [Tropheryma whipplei TW08/27]|nr:hypothetical protein TW021 [Tropheryma whipplei TW08/27]
MVNMTKTEARAANAAFWQYPAHQPQQRPEFTTDSISRAHTTYMYAQYRYATHWACTLLRVIHLSREEETAAALAAIMFIESESCRDVNSKAINKTTDCCNERNTKNNWNIRVWSTRSWPSGGTLLPRKYEPLICRQWAR